MQAEACGTRNGEVGDFDGVDEGGCHRIPCYAIQTK